MQKLEGLRYKDVEVFDEPCWLVVPDHIGLKWTEENKRFRSAIVRKSDGKVISQGFRKFTNFHEQPDFEPWNPEWQFKALKKVDGALLIVSFFKNKWLVRTRETVDARIHQTGNEIDTFMETHRKFFDNASNVLGEKCTVLFEHTSPRNRIVLNESISPKLWLLNIVDNETGLYWHHLEVDKFAEQFELERPTYFEFKNIEECIQDVKNWKGSEGVVIISPDNNTLKKIKAEEYLKLHRLKSELTIDTLLNLFIVSKDIQSIKKRLEEMFDFEIIKTAFDDLDKIQECYQQYLNELEDVSKFMNSLDKDLTRRELASMIQTQYRDWRVSACFNQLDGHMHNNKLLEILKRKMK